MRTGLWSQWEMLTLNCRHFGNLIFATFMTESHIRNRNLRGPVSGELSEIMTEGALKAAEFCAELELPVSRVTALQMRHCSTVEEYALANSLLRNTLFNELEQKKFYGPLAQYTGYFENAELFGADVFKAFPSANEDITEAGTCLALERATACVMHLMRAVEVALAALAKALGIAPQNDWGSSLRLIEKELTNRAKNSGARTPDEQFYAEAATQFDHVRRAWRNPTMHVERTYTQARAAEILQSVKSFMSHLATKISE
jgi:predicted XRE-type DNA-binding protein